MFVNSIGIDIDCQFIRRLQLFQRPCIEFTQQAQVKAVNNKKCATNAVIHCVNGNTTF